jgi:hypothetical protein
VVASALITPSGYGCWSLRPRTPGATAPVWHPSSVSNLQGTINNVSHNAGTWHLYVYDDWIVVAKGSPLNVLATGAAGGLLGALAGSAARKRREATGAASSPGEVAAADPRNFGITVEQIESAVWNKRLTGGGVTIRTREGHELKFKWDAAGNAQLPQPKQLLASVLGPKFSS